MDHAVPDGFDYKGDIYRPPAEADSILLQATTGCSHNRCTFCGGFREKPFSLKERETLEADLRFAARYCLRQDRVFVLDGNALTMPAERWYWLLEAVRERLPWVAGTGSYGTALDIARKTDEELCQLRHMGLDRVYMGVESGHDRVLADIRKGVDARELLEQGQRLRNTGMVLRVTVMIGIAGRQGKEHARATGALLSALDPEVVGVLTLVPEPGTPMAEELDLGRRAMPDAMESLEEMRELLVCTDLSTGLFNASHPSNHLSFTARVPEEKSYALALLEKALRKDVPLRSEAERRL